ncbi:MAG TPA: polysaccharide deacetylase family protein [Polyangia bacterium]|nr:polysaccharide deacetylase family protein [Polyangia bacterium]
MKIRGGLAGSVALLLAACWIADCGSSSGPGGGQAAGSGGARAGSGGATGSGGGPSTGSGGSASGAGTGGAPAGGAGGAGRDASDGPGSVEAGGAGGAIMTLPGNGCAGGTCLNPNCTAMGAAQPIGTFAEIGFELRPPYIPSDVVIPTFDDVPDRLLTAADGDPFTNFGAGQWTKKMLQYFDANNMHVDFFINTDNFCDLSMNSDCVATLTSVLKNHNAANHTVHHTHMGGAQPYNADDIASSSCGFGAGDKILCDDEMKGVETLVDMLSGGGRPHLTRFRAPYGEPFQAGTPNLIPMQTLVARYAVNIGWQMDSEDSLCDNCKYTGVQIAGNVERAVGNAPGAGQWGVILMHGTYPWTYDAAKLLLDPQMGYFKIHNFRVGTVEDAVCWKYGKHSWEIVSQLTKQQRDPN